MGNEAAAAAAAVEKPRRVRVWEASSGFPVERRLVWIMEGAPQVNFRMEQAHKLMWVNVIDRIVGSRRAAKGIVHTTSFERARLYMEHSQHKHRLIANDNRSRSTQQCVTNFRRSLSPLVLVSPSVTTGWDFPEDECRFQIVGKIPFPDLRTKAAKVKAKRNPEWAAYQAAQTIVQSTGRGMRSAGDWCESFIVDGNWAWWWRGAEKYTPEWWRESIRYCAAGRMPPLPSVDI